MGDWTLILTIIGSVLSLIGVGALIYGLALRSVVREVMAKHLNL
jgi:small-conductance mechanosensitive channel